VTSICISMSKDRLDWKFSRSERKVRILEDMIENLTRELYEKDEKNKHLELFASMASHDLKSPLNNIKGLARLAREGDEKDLPRIIELIDQSSNRMAKMIDALLEFSRLESKLNILPVDCNELLKKIVTDLSSKVEQKNAEILIGDLPTIDADENLIGLVFQNLISNALKFVKQDQQPVIHISGLRNDQFWHFETRDDGAGIPEEHQTEIFEVFTRLDETKAGFGIGLATCKKIVEKHGGKIWVEDNPQGGSIFHFTVARPT
jgi:chemotaxis family two-component system sensor kinase Cph1